MGSESEPKWVQEIRMLAQTEPVRLQNRLDRIAEAHQATEGPAGTTDGLCAECSHLWPCPTNTWATTDRDSIAAWDPGDNE